MATFSRMTARTERQRSELLQRHSPIVRCLLSRAERSGAGRTPGTPGTPAGRGEVTLVARRLGSCGGGDQRWLFGLQGLVGSIAAVVAFVSPQGTVVAAVFLFGAWAISTGLVDAPSPSG